MCNTTTIVRVWIAADLSYTSKLRWKDTKIDTCISDLVLALQSAAIDMRASCCGHGKANGSILLQDGRELEVWIKQI
jgi:hypothetical protein